MMKRILVLLAAAVLCIGIAWLTNYDKEQPASNAVETAATAAAPLPRQPTAIGINLFTLAYWGNERAFMNLAAGGAWRVITSNWSDLDPARLDRDANVKWLQPGEAVALALTKPARAYKGDLRVRCTYEGKGAVGGVGMDGLRATPGRLDFIWKSDNLTSHFRIDATDPADPVRNIDCREADADPRARFDPDFVASIGAFKSVRFMDWQQANTNIAGDWAMRTLPTATIQVGGGHGVALEHMVALANQAKVDPWFVLPWNGNAAYQENFARYVHDRLDPSLRAYIEVGNEVWNRDFPVAKQAIAEGMKLKVGKTEDEARMRRYAQRSVEVFKVWERVYAGEPKRLVRVLSGQNAWPDLMVPALSFADTVQHIDALSSAVYFGQDLLAEPPADTSDLTPLFAKLHISIDSTFASARKFKQMADNHGLRFISYEGGQHISYHGPDRTLSARLNRDPRMGEAFRIFLTRWDREFGDLLMIYHLTSPMGTSASFGLREYPGQPLAETPKLKAVLDAIAATQR
jgi:hypothetical protein